MWFPPPYEFALRQGRNQKTPAKRTQKADIVNLINRFAVSFIVLYQKSIRPLLLPSCRFYPSCSEYTRQAVSRYGLMRGAFLGLARIFRCHPFSKKSGYDPLT